MWSLETLLQAAAKVAGASPSTAKAPSINVMAIRQRQWGNELGSSYALVDSGATHALRRASTIDEWEQASPVVVRLAGGESVSLKMNNGGTIVVPMASATMGSSSTPIVPLGALVSQLGYSMVWAKNKCRLEGPQGEIINMKIRDGCPELTEHQALELIARLEDARLDQLRKNTAETKTRVRAAAMAMSRTWFDHLLSYVDSEFSSEGFKAVEAAPFLDGIPKQCLAGIFDSVPESNGWDILRGLKHLNRKTRKRLWSSDSWIVHLFAGGPSQKGFVPYGKSWACGFGTGHRERPYAEHFGPFGVEGSGVGGQTGEDCWNYWRTATRVLHDFKAHCWRTRTPSIKRVSLWWLGRAISGG